MKNSLQRFRLAKSALVAAMVGAAFTLGTNYAFADDSTKVIREKSSVTKNKTQNPTPDPTPEPTPSTDDEATTAYSDKDGFVTILTTNGGIYTIENDLNAISLHLKGDGTGAVKLNGDLQLSKGLKIDETLLDVIDGQTRNYVVNSLYTKEGSLAIDVNLNTMTADKFIVNGDSEGILYLDKINFTGNADEFTIQILDLNGDKNDLELEFGDNINIIGLPGVGLLEKNVDLKSILGDTVEFGDIYAGEKGLTLTSTKTYNDSITVVKSQIFDDILAYINQKNTLTYVEPEGSNNDDNGKIIAIGSKISSGSIIDRITDPIIDRIPVYGERNFNFKTSDDVYKVGTMLCNDEDYKGIGYTAPGQLNINGVSDGNGNYSTIDFNGYNGFIIGENVILKLNNVTIKNAKNAIKNGITNISDPGTAIVNNTKFQNNTTVENGGAIYNNGLLNVDNAVFQSNSAKQNGGAIYNSGTFYRTIGRSAVTLQPEPEEIVNANLGILNINNTSFYNNYVLSNKDALGGAIYTRGYKDGMVENENVQNYMREFNSNWFNRQYGPNSAFVIMYGSPEESEKVVSTNIVNASFVGNYAATTDTSAGNKADWDTQKTLNDIDEERVLIEGENDPTALPKPAITPAEPTATSSRYATTSDKSTQVAHGGAIYMVNDLNLAAKDGYTSVISGNYVVDSDGKRDEAIYVTSSINKIKEEVGVVSHRYTPPFNMETIRRYTLDRVYKDKANLDSTALNIEATTNGQFIIDDKIVGEERGSLKILDQNYYSYTSEKRPAEYYDPDNYITTTVYLDDEGNEVSEENVTYTTVELPRHKLNLIGDSTGKVTLNNNVENLDVNLSDITLHLGRRDNVLDGNNLVINSGTLNMVNNQVGISALQSLTLNGDANFIADVDLAKSTMDRFTADSYGEHKGNLNVIGMNILSDATKATTDIYFAQPGLKDNVVSLVGELPDNNQTTVYSPIYKYNVKYENRDDAGYFVFNRGAARQTNNPSDNFNPSVLVNPVGLQAAAQTVMNQTFNYVFEHADTFMTMPNLERVSKINSNSVALSTDYNQNLGVIDIDHANKGVWVRPYSAFENLPLRHGPKVDVISYGTFVGFDSEIHKLKHGWANVGTAYIGYNGAQLDYNNVDSSMNSGLLGLTETFYKGNFFTALTATAGAGVIDSNTMYGHEDSAFMMGGIGSKTGYNFEFKGGKFIIQPIMFMSYSLVKGFDYTNSANVRIKNDLSHTVQINPSVRFIGNIDGWQPYVSVGMVWDILHESNTRANGVKLPEMYTKPYVQYGVGLQRCWDDKFSAFGQAMIRNGGRNGISLTFGFRWALGKGAELVNKSVKDLKQSNSKQKHGKGKTILKQIS